jgi:hypothetical protein
VGKGRAAGPGPGPRGRTARGQNSLRGHARPGSGPGAPSCRLARSDISSGGDRRRLTGAGQTSARRVLLRRPTTAARDPASSSGSGPCSRFQDLARRVGDRLGSRVSLCSQRRFFRGKDRRARTAAHAAPRDTSSFVSLVTTGLAGRNTWPEPRWRPSPQYGHATSRSCTSCRPCSPTATGVADSLIVAHAS